MFLIYNVIYKGTRVYGWLCVVCIYRYFFIVESKARRISVIYYIFIVSPSPSIYSTFFITHISLEYQYRTWVARLFAMLLNQSSFIILLFLWRKQSDFAINLLLAILRRLHVVGLCCFHHRSIEITTFTWWDSIWNVTAYTFH